MSNGTKFNVGIMIKFCDTLLDKRIGLHLFMSGLLALNGNNIFVAESGIKSQADLNYLKENNIKVFLIGESLMRNNFK